MYILDCFFVVITFINFKKKKRDGVIKKLYDPKKSHYYSNLNIKIYF